MEQKIFDDFPKVNCNECENYYTNACDGAMKGSERPCKTFLAIRSVNIPAEIKALRERLNKVIVSVLFIGVALLIHLLMYLF